MGWWSYTKSHADQIQDDRAFITVFKDQRSFNQYSAGSWAVSPCSRSVLWEYEL